MGQLDALAGAGEDHPVLADHVAAAESGKADIAVAARPDIAVAGPFANFRHTRTKVDPERYPRTVAYVDRILARPSFAPWIEREAAFLSKEAA